MFDDTLLRNNYNQLYCNADFETESLNLHYAKPWQLFYLLAKGNKIVSEHNHFIYWKDLNIGETAKRITQFNENEYKQKAEDPIKVLDELDSYLYSDNYKIIFHNAIGYDVFIHNTFRRLLGKKTDFSWLNRLYDTHCIAKAIFLNLSPDKNNFLAWLYKLYNLRQKGLKTNLGYLGRHYQFEIDETNLHKANIDVPLNFKIFNKQLWQIEI